MCIRDRAGSGQLDAPRGHSSIGRAPALQAGGPGFDSPCLHPGQRPFPLDGKGLFHVRTPRRSLKHGVVKVSRLVKDVAPCHPHRVVQAGALVGGGRSRTDSICLWRRLANASGRRRDPFSDLPRLREVARCSHSRCGAPEDEIPLGNRIKVTECIFGTKRRIITKYVYIPASPPNFGAVCDQQLATFTKSLMVPPILYTETARACLSLTVTVSA